MGAHDTVSEELHPLTPPGADRGVSGVSFCSVPTVQVGKDWNKDWLCFSCKK